MKRAISLLLTIAYAVAVVPLAHWGANQGPGLSFRLVWILTLLAYALAQMALSNQPGRRWPRQLADFFSFLGLGCLIGFMLGISQIGFDNMGLGQFLQLIAGLGGLSAVLVLGLRSFGRREAQP